VLLYSSTKIMTVFKAPPRADCPCEQGGYGSEEPTNQLHTCLYGKAIEEVRDFLERGVKLWVGTTR
jgi:hypothetical protein